MPPAPERSSAAALVRRTATRLTTPLAIGLAAAVTAATGVTVVALDVAGSPAEVTPGGLSATSVPTQSPTAEAVVPGDAATRARPAVPQPPVQPLGERLRPDVLVTSTAPLAPEALQRLAELGRTAVVRAGTVAVGARQVPTVGVDPSVFRAFAAQGTAEADAVWQAVARGEAIVSHAVGKDLGLQLGAEVVATPAGGGPALPLRLGALATTGVPGSDLVVDDATGERLGLAPATGVVVSAPQGKDPVALAGAVGKVVGKDVRVDLLSQPAQNPVAFLTGSKAAKAFGAFSYRYFPDGTIAPDAAWVRANIVTTTVPIMGRVTCHRLMVPQLRGALQEVQDAGLGQLLKTYDGCYVPRFIARNPDNSISLHTWGIAIDMDAATNYRGIRGTMDDRIVAIFKRWGFRWGGDWAYTDPMHFELGALLVEPQG